MATLKQLVQIQSAIDNRAIAKDTIATLENNYYYSKSKGLNIKLADMHIDHFFRAFKIDDHQKKSVQDETQEIIQQQKKTLRKIKRLLNEQ